jgi:outer membrane lipoprotein-sorting protein
MYYGKVSEFWVDKQTLLLRHIRVTDFFGKLYEDYQYRNIVTGAEAHLSDKDFDPENPDYGGF